MPKYQVIHYYTSSEVFEVDADTEQDALDKVVNGEVKASILTEPEFCDEMVEELT